MIGGILLGIYGDLSNPKWILFLGTTSLLSVLLLINTKKRPSLRKEFLFGILIQLTFVSIGINLIVFRTAKNKPTHYQKFTEGFENDFIIEVKEIPKEKPNSIQVVAEVTNTETNALGWVNTTGSLLLYFEKDTLSKRILQGDQVYIKCNLQDILAPQNPGQFNYKQYLSFNEIYQQGYVQGSNWLTLSTGHFSLIGYASSIRDQLLDLLKTYGLQGDQLAVASALILGYKDDLDNELKHSYSSAGATHVLAVSGLHVGIIFLAISSLLKLIDRKEKYVFFRLILALLTLWSYAMITGLSPSVVRAATMFSFVAIGKAFQRDSNIYNTLAGSGLILLILNPYLVMEVGFQPCYLDVITNLSHCLLTS